MARRPLQVAIYEEEDIINGLAAVELDPQRKEQELAKRHRELNDQVRQDLTTLLRFAARNLGGPGADTFLNATMKAFGSP